jgi:hypothetical protein
VRKYPKEFDTNSKLFRAWRNMICRCYYPKDTDYKWYGARGITVCDEWREYAEFIKWAIISGYVLGLTIERKDNDRGYSPSNCCWVPRNQQPRHTRRVLPHVGAFGEMKILRQWAADERCKVSLSTLKARLEAGMTLEWALTHVTYARRRNQAFERKSIKERLQVSAETIAP